MKKPLPNGFTLFELMIVVAIISILATLALPSYHDYITKTSVTSAFGEISSAKINVEVKVSLGMSAVEAAALSGSSDDVMHMLSLPGASTKNCSSIVSNIDANGVSSIVCTIKGNLLVTGLKIRLQRTGGFNGVWTCETNAIEKFTPQFCAANAAIS